MPQGRKSAAPPRRPVRTFGKATGKAAITLRLDAEAAAGLNRSHPFMLRLDILARLPLTRAWFPDMEQPGRGIISVAPTLLREELTRLAASLVRRRRDLLCIRGP